MREADYSIDVLWDGGDVVRRLVEWGVLERWEGGRNWKCSVCDVVNGRLGNSRLGKIVRAYLCCGVYHAPAVLQAGGGLTVPRSCPPRHCLTLLVQRKLGREAWHTSPCKANIDIRILHPKQDSRIFGLCIGLTLDLSIGIHQAPRRRSAAMSDVCVFSIVTRRGDIGDITGPVHLKSVPLPTVHGNLPVNSTLGGTVGTR